MVGVSTMVSTPGFVEENYRIAYEQCLVQKSAMQMHTYNYRELTSLNRQKYIPFPWQQKMAPTNTKEFSDFWCWVVKIQILVGVFLLYGLFFILVGLTYYMLLKFIVDIFDQISSSKGYVDKSRLRIFLKDALQVNFTFLVVGNNSYGCKRYVNDS